MKIVDSWRQVDGGVRYLLRDAAGVEVTVDVDRAGRLSGFVRGPARADEDEILRRAWAIVRRMS